MGSTIQYNDSVLLLTQILHLNTFPFNQNYSIQVHNLWTLVLFQLQLIFPKISMLNKTLLLSTFLCNFRGQILHKLQIDYIKQLGLTSPNDQLEIT